MRTTAAKRELTSKGTVEQGKALRQRVSKSLSSARLGEVMAVAGQRGLLSGTRTHILRGRMPAGLVQEAKRKTGISSDSKLLEAALASLVVADEYAQWLFAQRGTVNAELDLEF